jgi:hypothetical protein
MPIFTRKNQIIKERGGTAHELDGLRPVGDADSPGGTRNHRLQLLSIAISTLQSTVSTSHLFMDQELPDQVR